MHKIVDLLIKKVDACKEIHIKIFILHKILLLLAWIRLCVHKKGRFFIAEDRVKERENINRKIERKRRGLRQQGKEE